MPFDFFLPQYNICIEYQGRQHYKEGFDIFMKRYKNQEKAILEYEKQRARDRIKKQYCKKHNLTLLEIKYTQDVEKILNKIIIHLLQPNR